MMCDDDNVVVVVCHDVSPCWECRIDGTPREKEISKDFVPLFLASTQPGCDCAAVATTQNEKHTVKKLRPLSLSTPPPPYSAQKMSKVNTAPIKWAQRSDSLYITIALPGECIITIDDLSVAAVAFFQAGIGAHRK